jgi:hypothetical protein
MFMFVFVFVFVVRVERFCVDMGAMRVFSFLYFAKAKALLITKVAVCGIRHL